MAIIGLDHIQIAIPAGGEDRARRFYGDLLGMHEVPKPDNLSPTGCWFERGGVSLHIGVDPEFVPARKAHPAFLVDDLASLRTRLETANIETHDDKPVEGYARFFTFDPFGNRVEFMQRGET
ncbi:VOC family protein [Erythrobacter sp. GH1-10]|uniref:VOC family protein n=1 Tax=Erythrobacter sp. GH1-10 TaxID=3349334 RepID=UPI003877DD20